MNQQIDPTTQEAIAASLRASSAIVRASDPKAVSLGAIMTEPASVAAGGLLAKLLPAGIGALIMACVDHPESRREFVLRVLVAFAVGYYLRGPAVDFLHSFSLFDWVDKTNDEHKHAVSFLLGAVGWSAIGGASMLLKKFRADPVAAVEEAKKVV